MAMENNIFLCIICSTIVIIERFGAHVINEIIFEIINGSAIIEKIVEHFP